MKSYIFNFFLLSIVMLSCSKDNYIEPQLSLRGRILYNNTPLNLEFNQVSMQLWETGWGKLAPIDITVSQEGTFSSLLFSGKYKLIIPKNQGPFITQIPQGSTSDTLFIDLKENQNVDIQVIPYYLIKNIKYSSESNIITSLFDINQIISGAAAKDIERVSLYINKSQFVSGSTNIGISSISGSALNQLSNIKMSISIPKISPDQGYVYARVGLKISGVEDMIFSPVQKLNYK